jgi:hypothetical protein
MDQIENFLKEFDINLSAEFKIVISIKQKELFILLNKKFLFLIIIIIHNNIIIFRLNRLLQIVKF